MNETEALIKELNYNVDWLVSKYKESTLSENFWRTGAYSVFEDDTELINLKTSNKKLEITNPSKKDWKKILITMFIFALLQGALTLYLY